MKFLWSSSNYYLTGIALLLSVILAQFFLLTFFYFKKRLGAMIQPVNCQLPELLSLLILPATYQQGIVLLKQTRPYKNYLPLIEELITRHHQTGHSMRQSFEELRNAIALDIKFENDQRLYLKQTFAQYFCYMAMTYLMALLFVWAGFQLSWIFYLGVVFGHLMGFALLIIYIVRTQRVLRQLFESFVPNLYKVMTSLEQLNLLSKSEVMPPPPAPILRFRKILEELVSRRMSFGVSISFDLILLAKEFWFFWENHWKQVTLNVERVKFVLMILFFGGGYMALLYGISSQVASTVFA